ncbi:cytochrome P450 52E2 [Xylaria palmicola]|nr:cytochrome P450 52E2 [Xylaria palmicola]
MSSKPSSSTPSPSGGAGSHKVVVPRATARLRYLSGVLALLVLGTGRLVSSRPPLALLALLALLVFGPLRAAHDRHVRAARLGCRYGAGSGPGSGGPRRYPRRDVLGVRFLAEAAAAIRGNRLLERFRELLSDPGSGGGGDGSGEGGGKGSTGGGGKVDGGGGLGHTFVHATFPEGRDTVTTDEPENVRAVLCVKFEDWALPAMRIRGFLPVLGKHSIFTTNGAEWQHSRAILRPAFVRDQISDLACIDRHVGRLITRLRTTAAADDNAVVDLQAEFSMLTTDTISDFMLGQSTDLLGGDAPADSYTFGRYFDQAMVKIAWRARLGSLTMLRRDPELETYAAFLRDFVTKFVKEVREQADTNTHRGDAGKYVFLDELLKSGESDEVICDHLLSIFTAGRDTQTSVLSYLFYELSRRPDVAGAIRAEMAAQLGPDADPTWDDLRGLRYLNWALKEALRLNPPVASNSREAVRDTVLPRGGGPDGSEPFFVAKGTTVRYVPWIMHRRRDIYGEDADEFRPERWEHLRVTHEYVPFNAGPRICIGQQFALTQMALITFRLLQAFKAIERRDDRPAVQKLGINLSMLHGCLVSLTPA